MAIIHLIGVGGVGMRALAELLIANGLQVTGSDLNQSEALVKLQAKGLTLYLEHDAENVLAADIVVRSSAISDNHVEWRAASELGKELLHRSDMLRRVTETKRVIAVTGTHGKTSTTAMIAHILMENNFAPGFAIGSSWSDYPCGAHYGSGEWFVVEADESDGSFLNLEPEIGIMLNLEPEHMKFYQYYEQKLLAAYKDFADQAKTFVYCKDDPRLSNLLDYDADKISYASTASADVTIIPLAVDACGHHYELLAEGKIITGCCSVVGKHQLLNMAAAYAVCRKLGIESSKIVAAMQNFVLPGRRFEELGAVAGIDDTILIDDYGHHPSEIQATVAAIKLKYPNRRLVMAYQPHKYSRLKDYFPDFVEALAKVDNLILLDVFPAGESEILGYTSDDLASKLSCVRVSDDAKAACLKMLQPGDIMLCQGAGDITNLAHSLRFGKVAVVYGGWSNERAVSLTSGEAILSALKDLSVSGFDIKSSADVLKLAAADVDLFLLALHGGDGENGHIQACLELLGLNYTGSGTLASALCMNKAKARIICDSVGVPVVPWQEFVWHSPPATLSFKFPVCLKPIDGGSSLSVRKISDQDSWHSVCQELTAGIWLVEPWLSGLDHFVGMLDGQVLPVLEVHVPEGDFFSYDNKYAKQKDYNIVQNSQLQAWTKQAYNALGCKGYARADFITIGDKSWFLEMNTLPGMSPGSLLPLQAKAAGLSYKEFLLRIIRSAYAADLL